MADRINPAMFLGVSLYAIYQILSHRPVSLLAACAAGFLLIGAVFQLYTLLNATRKPMPSRISEMLGLVMLLIGVAFFIGTIHQFFSFAFIAIGLLIAVPTVFYLRHLLNKYKS